MTRDLSPEHVRFYVHAPKEVTGGEEQVSNATKRHRHSHLATFFRWAIPNDPVFTDEKGNLPRLDRVTKRFKFYVRRAKLQDREDLHFHSLRHTTASWLTMEGVPKQVIAEVWGTPPRE